MIQGNTFQYLFPKFLEVSFIMCCFSTNLYSSLTKMLFLCSGEFVKLHHLEEGDLLILYRSQKGNFVSKLLWNLTNSSYFTHSNCHSTSHSKGLFYIYLSNVNVAAYPLYQCVRCAVLNFFFL